MKEVLTDTLVNEQPFKIKTNKQKKKQTHLFIQRVKVNKHKYSTSIGEEMFNQDSHTTSKLGN